MDNMTSTPTSKQKWEDWKRRQRHAGKSGACISFGIIVADVTFANAGHHVNEPLQWIVLALCAASIMYGFVTLLPVRREMKRECEEWKKREQAELDAANEFLFGAGQKQS